MWGDVDGKATRLGFAARWLTVILAVLVVLWFAAIGVSATKPTVTPTPDYITTKVGTYWLSTGARVDWWLDEPRGLLCESLHESASLSCVPLPMTTYGLPAVEGP